MHKPAGTGKEFLQKNLCDLKNKHLLLELAEFVLILVLLDNRLFYCKNCIVTQFIQTVAGAKCVSDDVALFLPS